jgi:PAS domain S-box-containing protein
MIKDKKQYSFLIIEDNPGDLIIVEDMLCEQILNPVIYHANNFTQAMELVKIDGYSAILLDLSLPDKSRELLVSEVMSMSPIDCPIIVLTGYTDIDFSKKAIAQGVMDYLLKDELTAANLYKSIIYSIERKNSIVQIKASEKRYSDLFTLSPQPMWVFEIESLKFFQVNSAAIELYGYREDEFLKMNILDINPREGKTIRRPVAGADPLKSYHSAEPVFHKKKSGEIIEVEIFSNPIEMHHKKCLLAIVFDVTEKKQFELKLIKTILKTQEDERYEIGGELHDNVCQILAATRMNLSMLKDAFHGSNNSIFEQCTSNIDLALVEVRNLSHRLAPVFFDEVTIEGAILKLFDTFNAEEKMKLSLFVDDAVKKLPINLEVLLNFYRIIQEQLRNVFKHAGAKVIKIVLGIVDERLQMSIIDDGIGFNMANNKSGIGITNMKRRVESFAGNFDIYSSPGKGCEIFVSIPLSEIS